MQQSFMITLRISGGTIGIGLPITEEPSHTTRHTDRVPGRFG
ncbi:MAG: hypothetical protein PHG14_15405 [Desulfobacter postgatei]|nr:hypothetical protein [Desulfobacter postgatei]MDD4275101.1 hypothetical protein [Desulfobacter postgatei]